MKKRAKKPMDMRKRFFADCSNCSASFEADRYEDTRAVCSCGTKLTWNDKAKLKTLDGKR